MVEAGGKGVDSILGGMSGPGSSLRCSSLLAVSGSVTMGTFADGRLEKGATELVWKYCISTGVSLNDLAMYIGRGPQACPLTD